MDTGSTHNFASDRWMKKLGLTTQCIKEFPVVVASDKPVIIDKKCEQLRWKFKDHEFVGDFLVLPGSHFGVILGTQWLKTLGEIRWNCKSLTMKFEHARKTVKLVGEQQGRQHQGATIVMNCILPKAMLLSISVLETQQETSHLETTLTEQQQQDLTEILLQFEDLFRIPTQLPPHRKYDHQIHLTNNTPLSSKSYRYPHAQKKFNFAFEELLNCNIQTISYTMFS